MAKEQNLSLNPTKISGVCGRLMCCLKNEEETYEELNRRLPGIGDYVTTEDGLKGEVQSVNVLRQLVKVVVETGDEKEIKEYPVEQLQFKRRHGKKEKIDLTKEEMEALEQLEEKEMQEEREANTKQETGQRHKGNNRNHANGERQKDNRDHQEGEQWKEIPNRQNDEHRREPHSRQDGEQRKGGHDQQDNKNRQPQQKNDGEHREHDKRQGRRNRHNRRFDGRQKQEGQPNHNDGQS